MTITAILIACAFGLLLAALLWRASDPGYKVRCTACGHLHRHVKRGDKRKCPGCGADTKFT